MKIIEITKPIIVKRDAKINSLCIQDIINCLCEQWGFNSESIDFGNLIQDVKRGVTYFNTNRPLFF